MHRRIVILLITSALVVKVYSDNGLKCYMCTSLSNEGCGSNLTSLLQPVECTGNKMIEWQRSIEQHKVLKSIAQLFKVDEALQHYQGTPHHMACAKMILHVENQDVTIRTCQMAETEVVDPCKAMDRKLKETVLGGRMEQCALCLKEACNGTILRSSEIFYILLAFFGTLIHVALYH